ncbi:MAG: formamidopyrimidine-DNA glycosylase [Candidatus Omnitrophica bacterium]|nr:formamidopyrimidine-DNA glycosylase [Candidatus Omnitrophota bacterium]MCF7879005.1 formamidopyrimidine-DNA glycosylase [Candidatus Omnitrophota bacterium]MCF7888151.1 formamidopyrimidine-DNA glycosylase [Candidatus Omnitrophota bacterium]
MPELPDVEIFRRYLSRTSLNKKIKEVDLDTAKIVEGVSASKLKKELKGKKFKTTKRIGKNLFVKIDKKWLLFHFGMTGFINYFKKENDKPKHTRLLIHFSNGNYLAFVNTRLLGKVTIINNLDNYLEDKRIGEDALTISYKEFKPIIDKANKSIKSFFMDQTKIAGSGNIYTDEILYQAKILPKKKANKLSDKNKKKVFDKMKYVLKKAIESRADPGRIPSGWLLNHRDESDKCPKCSKKIKRVKVSGRSAYFCKNCQK